MSNAPAGGMLAATPVTVAGFMVSDVVGFGVLAVVAGVGLVVAAHSRWSRRSNDSALGLR